MARYHLHEHQLPEHPIQNPLAQPVLESLARVRHQGPRCSHLNPGSILRSRYRHCFRFLERLAPMDRYKLIYH